jgi:glyoxylase-like metal-dependent hydrolase (beta-lactamase superfamily II)
LCLIDGSHRRYGAAMGVPLVEAVVVTPFAQNCHVVAAARGGPGLLIDPGGEAERIEAALIRLGVEPVAVLGTHGHLDHIGAAAQVADPRGIPVYLHEDDRALFEWPGMGLWDVPAIPRPGDLRPLADGERLQLAGLTIDVLHTPGHTPGQCVFHLPEHGLLFSGDLLFAGSIGRTDFPTGDPARMGPSLARVMALPDATRVHSGHGPVTTIGRERAANPFVAGLVA